jgi:hypothetical protein
MSSPHIFASFIGDGYGGIGFLVSFHNSLRGAGPPVSFPVLPTDKSKNELEKRGNRRGNR